MTSPKLSANCVLSKYFAHKLSDVMTSPNLSANCALSKLILLLLSSAVLLMPVYTALCSAYTVITYYLLQYRLCLFILSYAVLILLLLSSAVLLMPVYTVLCSTAYACLYCLMQYCLYLFILSYAVFILFLKESQRIQPSAMLTVSATWWQEQLQPPVDRLWEAGKKTRQIDTSLQHQFPSF